MSSEVTSRRNLIVPTVLLIGLGVFAAVKFTSPTPERVRAEGGTTPSEQCGQSGIAIVSSVPVDGFVDARADASSAGSPLGISSIDLSFDTPVELSTECIDILTTASTAPQISTLTGADYDWTIELDSPMPSGESTAIVLWAGLVHIVYHSYPGDVDLDGVSDENDVTALEAAVQAGSSDLDRYDIDRDGDVDSADVDRLEDLLSGGYGGTVWWGVDDPDLRVFCCCVVTDCTIHFTTFCGSGEEIACPCYPNPCVSRNTNGNSS